MAMDKIKNRLRKPRHLALFLGALVVVFFLSIFSVYASGKAVAAEPHMNWVSHTEYWNNDNASTIVRVTNYKGDPYDMDECRVTILYPDKTVFIDSQPMTESAIPGNWYRADSLLDAPLGTYEQQVVCTKGSTTIRSSQSFHLNPALEQIRVLTEKSDNLDLDLADVSATINANIADSNDRIQARIDGLDTSLNTLLQDVETNISDQLTSTNSTLSTQLSDVNISIQGKVETTGNAIRAQLSAMNVSLEEAILSSDNSVVNDLNARLDEVLADITNQVSGVKTDTGWLTQNAMHQDNMAEITARFNGLDRNLALVEQFCSNPETNSSDLCQEIDGIAAAIATMDTEQENYLSSIDTTTTNIWQLLSVDFANNIDSIMADIGIIKSQTTDINATTHEILGEIQGDVRVSVIS